VLILEGYGLTEAGPVVSVNRVSKFKFGSVGIPLKNTRIKFAKDGEILVNAPSVMKGYFNRPQETYSAFENETWLKTGDIGRLDADGFLHIIGRKKDFIKTFTGKRIAPQEIETRLLEIPYIERTVVIGEGLPHLIAVIFPAFPQLRSWARQQGLKFKDNNDLLTLDRTMDLFKDRIKGINSMLAPFERISGMLLVNPDTRRIKDLFTPSLHVNRRLFTERFSDDITRSLIPIEGDTQNT